MSLTQAGGVLTLPSPLDNAEFGVVTALSRDGTWLAVPDISHSNNRGRVYFYQWSSGSWVPPASGAFLDAPDAADNDNFGFGLALSEDGNILAVSSYPSPGATSAVYIFDRVAGNWVQRGAKFRAADTAESDVFGHSLALSADGTLLAVGAPFIVPQGAVYVFQWNGTAWVQKTKFGEPTSGNMFGRAVAFSGDGGLLAVQGDALSNNDNGKVFVYTGNLTTFSYALRDSLQESTPLTGGSFGVTVALSSNGLYMVVGKVDSPGNNTGIAVNGIETYAYHNGAWILLDSLDAPIALPEPPGFFCVSVSGDYTKLVVGAYDYNSAGQSAPPLKYGGVYTYTVTLGGILSGAGFKVSARLMDAADGQMVGTGFKVSASMEGLGVYGNLLGNGFAVTAVLSGGSQLYGTGFKVGAYLAGTGVSAGRLAGNGFNVSAKLSGTGTALGRIRGGGFKTKATLYGGAYLFVRGALFKASATLVGYGFSGKLSGTGFRVSATLAGRPGETARLQASVTIRAQAAGRAALSGRLFKVAASLQGYWVNHVAGYVVNVATGAASRYGNMPFLHIVTLMGVDYGLRADGLYRLDGSATDHNFADPAKPLPVNGRGSLKDTDFGVFHSKRADKIWLDSDTQTNWTPIVDGVRKLPNKTRFEGRRLDCAKGNTGRYWRWEFEGVERLGGIEIPMNGPTNNSIRQRRVK